MPAVPVFDVVVRRKSVLFTREQAVAASPTTDTNWTGRPVDSADEVIVARPVIQVGTVDEVYRDRPWDRAGQAA